MKSVVVVQLAFLLCMCVHRSTGETMYSSKITKVPTIFSELHEAAEKIKYLRARVHKVRELLKNYMDEHMDVGTNNYIN